MSQQIKAPACIVRLKGSLSTKIVSASGRLETLKIHNRAAAQSVLEPERILPVLNDRISSLGRAIQAQISSEILNFSRRRTLFGKKSFVRNAVYIPVLAMEYMLYYDRGYNIFIESEGEPFPTREALLKRVEEQQAQIREILKTYDKLQLRMNGIESSVLSSPNRSTLNVCDIVLKVADMRYYGIWTKICVDTWDKLITDFVLNTGLFVSKKDSEHFILEEFSGYVLNDIRLYVQYRIAALWIDNIRHNIRAWSREMDGLAEYISS